MDEARLPEDVPVACNLGAFDPAQHKRYLTLRGQLESSVVEVKEQPDGFAFRLPPDAGLLVAVAEWMGLEQLCCPFLGFALDLPSGGGAPWLTLTGPEGTKAILRDAFGIPDVSVASLLRRG
jgi:hypothetical protein